MDLERVGIRGRIGRVRERKKIGFLVPGKNNLFCFLCTLSSFQPNMGVSHEDLGSYFILEATIKEFMEEGIKHALCSEIQFLKCNDKHFHGTRLFQLGQTTQGACVGVKVFIKSATNCVQTTYPWHDFL
jgi:hypothetical protein